VARWCQKGRAPVRASGGVGGGNGPHGRSEAADADAAMTPFTRARSNFSERVCPRGHSICPQAVYSGKLGRNGRLSPCVSFWLAPSSSQPRLELLAVGGTTSRQWFHSLSNCSKHDRRLSSSH
jgi:hypothetical protein